MANHSFANGGSRARSRTNFDPMSHPVMPLIDADDTDFPMRGVIMGSLLGLGLWLLLGTLL